MAWRWLALLAFLLASPWASASDPTVGIPNPNSFVRPAADFAAAACSPDASRVSLSGSCAVPPATITAAGGDVALATQAYAAATATCAATMCQGPSPAPPAQPDACLPGVPRDLTPAFCLAGTVFWTTDASTGHARQMARNFDAYQQALFGSAWAVVSPPSARLQDAALAFAGSEAGLAQWQLLHKWDEGASFTAAMDGTAHAWGEAAIASAVDSLTLCETYGLVREADAACAAARTAVTGQATLAGAAVAGARLPTLPARPA